MDDRIISYLTLRKAIGVLGILLAPILVSVILIYDGHIEQSISAYYTTMMRDVMVGILVISGAFLISYRGYDLKDNIISWISGVSAIGVALFSIYQPIIHGIFAGIFFLSLAYMAYFQFTIGKNKKNNVIYKVCAVIILAGAIALPIIRFNYSVLIFETVMLLAFGTSWLVKGASFKSE